VRLTPAARAAFSSSWAWNCVLLALPLLVVVHLAPDVELRMGERAVRLGPKRPDLHLRPFQAQTPASALDSGDCDAWRAKVRVL